MSPKKTYQRDPDARLPFHGMNIVLPPDKVPAGKYPFAQNVRAYLHDRISGRTTQDSSVVTLPFSVHSIRRLNDSTPAGPAVGFILVEGASVNLYANAVQVDSGLSGNPISLVPFRPNASVQPWMYVGDSIKMDKVRSDGTRFAMGIEEPQAAPTVVSIPASNVMSLVGPVTVTYWGDSPHSGPTGSYIWKHAGDTGSGPVRSVTAPAGVSSGDSLQFDPVVLGTPSTAMQWLTYATFSGTVNTDTIGGTFNVHWVSGDQFGSLESGQSITIGIARYIINSVTSNILLKLTTTAGTQVGENYTAVAPSGTVGVFTPALESEGYSDFNFVVEATLYVPAAGTYILTAVSKDDMIWGIGGSSAGSATWPAPTGSQTLSGFGQKKTPLNGYPLMPRVATTSSGIAVSASVSVTFSAAGNYPLEIGYDYWFHSGRTLVIKANGINLQPIPGSVITEAQYRYVYRSSATGATSNPSPETVEQSLSVIANTLSATPSADPQVDKIDFYRLDTGLQNFTYVGTGPNTNASFSDSLLDADVAANPILEFDNFQPFPSIDLPRSGTVNVSGGVATWVSGDLFNVRWLPGTIIIVGTIAYTLDKRPTSETQLTASNIVIQGGVSTVIPVADGLNLPYEIAEPDLAAQPLPYLWGPTDNVAFFFGVGDPLRPGTLYWSKGNNPDSAPQTNQQDVTSPSEPLQNGVITNGIGLVMTPERGFLIYPNFFNALATVQGTVGATWTLQESISNRGLYMPRAIAVDGGGNVFFRAKDGIYVSPGGQGSKSITDEDLYNLFPHEGFVPQPVTRGGFTIFPPNDSYPQSQKMNVANGYLYYDYSTNLITTTTGVIGIGEQPIPVVSRAGMGNGVVLIVDTGSQQETVVINGIQFVPPNNYVARFTKSHAAGVQIIVSSGPGLCTLVYDIAAKGWVWDAYEHPVLVHVLEEGSGVNGVLTGCADGSIRPLTGTGPENASSVVLMPCSTAGDVRAPKHWADIYIEAEEGGE